MEKRRFVGNKHGRVFIYLLDGRPLGIVWMYCPFDTFGTSLPNA